MNATAKRAINGHLCADEDPELTRLLRPSTVYQAPSDVINDPALSLSEKKAILASWASDACSLENRPAFRHPPSLAEPVTFDGIMEALQELDRLQRAPSAGAARFADRRSSPVC